MGKKGSSPYLKKLFNQWNRKFWRGKLPEETVVRWASSRELASVLGEKRAVWGVFFYEGEKRGERPTILLNDVMRRKKWGNTARATLVHEMCHLEGKARDHHGETFNRRMLRVAKLGIFDSIW